MKKLFAVLTLAAFTLTGTVFAAKEDPPKQETKKKTKKGKKQDEKKEEKK